MSDSQIFILCVVTIICVILLKLGMSRWEREKKIKDKERSEVYCENCENSSLYGCRILNKYTGRYTDCSRDKNKDGNCTMYQKKEG